MFMSSCEEESLGNSIWVSRQSRTSVLWLCILGTRTCSNLHLQAIGLFGTVDSTRVWKPRIIQVTCERCFLSSVATLLLHC